MSVRPYFFKSSGFSTFRRGEQKEAGEKEELPVLHLDLNGLDVCPEPSLYLTTTCSTVLRLKYSNGQQRLCVHLQPCIVNQLDSWTHLPPLSLSLTQMDLLTVNYCDLACSFLCWLFYNALYGANDKYKLYMCSLLLICSPAKTSLVSAKQGRTQRQEIWDRKQ